VLGFKLTPTAERHIYHQLDALERRIVHRPEPGAAVVLRRHGPQRQIEADLRLQLSPLGPHLVSHQAAETADRALRLAVEDIERQLERHRGRQEGEPAFGVPSRRLPRELRPHPLTGEPPEWIGEMDDEV